eukprot:Hpha_TRINITY_DN15327_c3_g2::TRINITY_DN15327_c3_g2_i1::g.91052::m.91052/K08857/NEK1_4_5; NIMA (never in mitosis gene a)-related kinase 1/4/5
MQGFSLEESLKPYTWYVCLHNNVVRAWLPCARQTDPEAVIKPLAWNHRVSMAMLAASAIIVLDSWLHGHSCGILAPVLKLLPSSGAVDDQDNLWCWTEEHPRQPFFLMLGLALSPRITILYICFRKQTFFELMHRVQDALGVAQCWGFLLIAPHVLAVYVAGLWMRHHSIIVPIFFVTGLHRQIEEYRDWRRSLAIAKKHACHSKWWLLSCVWNWLWLGKWMGTLTVFLEAEVTSRLGLLQPFIVQALVFVHLAAMAVEAYGAIYNAVGSDDPWSGHGGKHQALTGRNLKLRRAALSAAPGSEPQFVVQRRLGSGGYGTVYLAQASDGTEVAVKRIQCEDYRAMNLAMGEAHRAMQFDHPHVVQIFSVYMEDTREFTGEGSTGDTARVDSGPSSFSFNLMTGTTPPPTAGSGGWSPPTAGSGWSPGSVGSSSKQRSSILKSSSGPRVDPPGSGISSEDSSKSGLDATVCIVMEYCDRGDLGRHAKEVREAGDGNLPAGMLRDWIVQISHALEYLHRHDIIHRDLKPRNVLVRSCGTLCLCDFGLARLQSNQQSASTGVGTYPYAAPEMFQHGVHTASVDMFALGCSIYDLAGLKLPTLEAGNGTYLGIQLLTAKENEGRSPQTEFGGHLATAGVDPELVSLTQRLWSKDPQHRPTAEEVSHELANSRHGSCLNRGLRHRHPILGLL